MVVADTHGLVFYLFTPDRLTDAALDALLLLQPISVATMVHFGAVPLEALRDPFDRFILAAALQLTAPLVTADRAIVPPAQPRSSGERRSSTQLGRRSRQPQRATVAQHTRGGATSSLGGPYHLSVTDEDADAVRPQIHREHGIVVDLDDLDPEPVGAVQLGHLVGRAARHVADGCPRLPGVGEVVADVGHGDDGDMSAMPRRRPCGGGSTPTARRHRASTRVLLMHADQPTAPPEQVVLLDDDGRPIGVADKATVHGVRTPRHLAFSCYGFGDDGRLLVTRRALTKRTFPGVRTNTCCGHPAPGEKLEDAVRRRLRTELGLAATDVRLVLPDFGYRASAGGIEENELCPVFVATLVGTPTPVPDEVDSFDWWAWDDFLAAALAGELSPWATLQAPLLDACRELWPDTVPR